MRLLFLVKPFNFPIFDLLLGSSYFDYYRVLVCVIWLNAAVPSVQHFALTSIAVTYQINNQQNAVRTVSAHRNTTPELNRAGRVSVRPRYNKNISKIMMTNRGQSAPSFRYQHARQRGSLYALLKNGRVGSGKRFRISGHSFQRPGQT